MGLDTIIVAFFVVATIILVANTFTIGITNFAESTYNGYSSIYDTTMNRMQTNIEIQNTWFNGTNGHLFFTLENTGETKLSDFDLWDIIVIKNGAASYLGSDEWALVFQNDEINPNILDPFEKIQIELFMEFNAGDHAIITVSTPNGILSSTEHTVGS